VEVVVVGVVTAAAIPIAAGRPRLLYHSRMPSGDDPTTLTLLLNEAISDDERLRRLLPVVYAQLRATAQAALAMERPDHTLQATALVHDAYLKLVGVREVPWANRAHFFAAAAEAMRRILIDHARAKSAAKRGGARGKTPWSLIDLAVSSDPLEVLALDEAFSRLEREEPDVAAVVRLRLFAGLTGDHTAMALGISPRQVDRHWAYARAWLARELDRTP
jgi:RNA polymerase sigma factor (TIGR02999 family)